MTLKQMQKYYGHDWVTFVDETGMSKPTWFRWQSQGYINLPGQVKLQRLTGGRLKADPNHDGRLVREQRMYGGKLKAEVVK